MLREYSINNSNLISKDIDIEKLLEENGVIAIFNENYITKIDDKRADFDIVIQKINKILSDINPDLYLEEIKKDKTYKKILLLKNLDCANCAAKIERLAQKEFNHEFINVDFATCRFIIETKDEDLYKNLISKVQNVANVVDSNIVVMEKEVEKETVNFDDEEEETRINKVTLIVGLILFTILVVLHYFVFNLCFEGYIIENINLNEPYLKWPLIGLAAASYILLGGDVLLGALKNISKGRVFDEKFLMALATAVAFGIHSYIEAIAVMVFYKIGELLQEYIVDNSRKSISELIDIKPSIARVIINDKEIETDPTQLAVGDKIVVKPGERIPADGIILDGEANLDMSALTGESKYYEVSKGKKVISGSINLDGVLYIEVKKKYSDSMVSKILDLVQNANTHKAKTEKFVTKFAKYYTPIVCALAVVIALYFLIFEERSVHDSFYPAMVFLVVSCPCALVISVPLGYFGAIGAASKRGILIKGSNYIDELNNIGVIAFDKTGTLTKGKFTVTNVYSDKEEFTADDILRIAAHCETVSNHPIAKSIVSKYGEELVSMNEVEAIAINKKGVEVKYGEETYYVGNASFLAEYRFKVKDIDTGFEIFVANKKGIIGRIELKDEIREESKETIKQLKAMGFTTIMLTGDNEKVAKSVFEELEMDRFYAGLTPVDKVKRVRKLKKEFKDKRVVFVGDGVNDAPVLNNVDIGIAMGKLGTDAAIEVSDVVLMNDDLSKLVDAVKIANQTKGIVLQNIIFALAIKLIVIIAAAIDRSGFIRMWEGVFADVGVSLIAILNSLRVSSIDKKKFFERINIFKYFKKGNK